MLRQAQADATVAAIETVQSALRAPVDGRLSAPAVEPGNVVQLRVELLVLAPSGETQTVVEIDEKDLAKLALGQSALVSPAAYPAGFFFAVVTYVNPGIDARRGAVEVKLRAPTPPIHLLQDMTVSVDIETASRAARITLEHATAHDGAGTVSQRRSSGKNRLMPGDCRGA